MSHQKLAQLLHRAAHRAESAETEVECPYCHNTFNVDQRPDDVTSESGQDDENNEDSGAEVEDYDNLRRPIDRLNALARSMLSATNRSQK
jgi:hypothetical protein